MKDIPIIFSAPMVRALLAGRKTQDRRLAFRSFEPLGPVTAKVGPETPWCRVQPGGRLWVREAFHPTQGNGNHDPRFGRPDGVMGYAADWNIGEPALKWRPSNHMPRWASRITLVVTEARRQRLKEISDLDVMAEGVDCFAEDGTRLAPCWPDFARLWDKLHGAGAWDSNPEVIALTFTVHRCNIDSLERNAA